MFPPGVVHGGLSDLSEMSGFFHVKAAELFAGICFVNVHVHAYPSPI